MGKLLLLAFALLAVMAVPHAGYTETLTVQVFDQDFRPVEGALVYVDYQLNSVQGHIKTKPHPTDSTGYYTVLFTDYEQIDASVDPTYTLFVKYGSQLQKYGLIAIDNEKRVYTGTVDSYYAFIRVHDQKGRPLKADVSISGGSIDTVKKTASDTGDAIFQLPPGSYTLKTEYNGVAKNKDFTLSSDTALDVAFGIYTMKVKVTDDRKTPLVATVEVGAQSAQTAPDGTASLVNISDSTPSVVIKYADRYKTYKPDLALEPGLVAIFDLTKPSIKDLHSTLAGSGEATITFFVEDAGSAASGVDTVAVSYAASGVDTPIPAYTVGYNTFEAKVPPQEPGTLVKYSVRVADKDGNAALAAESYIVPGTPAPAPTPSPAPKPTPAPSPIPSIPATTGGLPTELLVILGVAGILIVYAAIYYLKRRKEESFGKAQPPSVPPTQPPAI